MEEPTRINGRGPQTEDGSKDSAEVATTESTDALQSSDADDATNAVDEGEYKESNDSEEGSFNENNETDVADAIDGESDSSLGEDSPNEQSQSAEAGLLPKTNSFCPKCGSLLKEGQVFCGSCGAKIDSPNDDKKAKRKIQPKTIGIAGGIAAVIIIIIIALVAFIIPELTKTPIDLIKENNWEQAYSKASDEEKDDVLIANLSASMSKDEIIDSLKDPSSFNLREIYFSKTSHELVLLVGGKNSYGGMVSSFYYFTWNEGEGKFSLYTSLSDLESETSSWYDSSDEKLEKVLKNIARAYVKTVIDDSDNKLNSDYVDAINHLFEEDTLEDVTLLGDVNIKLGDSTNA